MGKYFIEKHLNIFGEKTKVICTRISKEASRFFGKKKELLCTGISKKA